MSNKFIMMGVVTLVTVVFVMGILYSYITSLEDKDYGVVCVQDAMMCPDGTSVGRSGPNCEFVCEPQLTMSDDLLNHINSMKEYIKVTNPVPMAGVTSPVFLSGEAVGSWYFEASAPVTLVNWDGLIIAEGYVTASDDWMTTDFVPFTGTLEFESPYQVGDPDFMKRGAIIFRNDNPSGLSENKKALELPIVFVPTE